MERYRLAPVRDARDRDERVKRGDLAAAVGSATASAEEVAAALARVELARAAVEQARASAPTTAGALARRERFIGRLRRDLEARRTEHAHKVAAHAGTLELLDTARDQLTRSRADRRVIERHFERWRAERKRIADRRTD